MGKTRKSNNKIKVIIGGPGTGKTQYLLKKLEKFVQKGTPPERIAFVTFTRPAVKEARDRVKDLFETPPSLPWIRTIHSTAYKLLGLTKRQIMNHKMWKKFADTYLYNLTNSKYFSQNIEDSPVELPKLTADDCLRYVYEWAKNAMMPIDAAPAKCGLAVPLRQLKVFAERLLDFKTKEHLLDYTDLLYEALKSEKVPDVDVAFIDEAQDLSPLQIAVINHWFSKCRHVFIAGDDDQAIYSFQGSDPQWLVSLSKEHPVKIFKRSHRIPHCINTFASQIIQRNKNRIVRDLEATQEDGELLFLTLEDALTRVSHGDNVLILARNRMFLEKPAKYFFNSGIPYVVDGPGGPSPFSFSKIVKAVESAVKLSRGWDLKPDELLAMLRFIPQRGYNLLEYGLKSKIETQLKDKKDLLPLHKIKNELGLGKVIEAIITKGPTSVLLRIDNNTRNYFQKILNSYKFIPGPTIKLTSIHGAKGLEADTVIVLPDMTKASYKEYFDTGQNGFEAENRVAYVAVTRARRRLIITYPCTKRFYNYPSYKPSKVEGVK